MSAFMHSRNHIRYLVEAGIRGDGESHSNLSWCWNIDREAHTYDRSELRPGCDEAARVGQMLMDANAESVRFRYSSSDASDLIGDTDYGDHRSPKRRLTPGAVFKAIDSYEYQSCDAAATLTDEKIHAIATDAVAHGDRYVQDLCDRALRCSSDAFYRLAELVVDRNAS